MGGDDQRAASAPREDGGPAGHHHHIRAGPGVGRFRVPRARAASDRAARRVGRRPDLRRLRRAARHDQRRDRRVRRDHRNLPAAAVRAGRQRRGHRAALPLGDPRGRANGAGLAPSRRAVHHAHPGVGDGRLLQRARDRDRQRAAAPVPRGAWPRRALEVGRGARLHAVHHGRRDGDDGVRAQDPVRVRAARTLLAHFDRLLDRDRVWTRPAARLPHRHDRGRRAVHQRLGVPDAVHARPAVRPEPAVGAGRAEHGAAAGRDALPRRRDRVFAHHRGGDRAREDACRLGGGRLVDGAGQRRLGDARRCAPRHARARARHAPARPRAPRARPRSCARPPRARAPRQAWAATR